MQWWGTSTYRRYHTIRADLLGAESLLFKSGPHVCSSCTPAIVSGPTGSIHTLLKYTEPNPFEFVGDWYQWNVHYQICLLFMWSCSKSYTLSDFEWNSLSLATGTPSSPNNGLTFIPWMLYHHHLASYGIYHSCLPVKSTHGKSPSKSPPVIMMKIIEDDHDHDHSVMLWEMHSNNSNPHFFPNFYL